MSNYRRKLRLSTVTVELGCSSCRRPKLWDIFNPKPKSTQKPKKTNYYPSSYSSPGYADEYYDNTTTTTATTATTASTFSPETDVRSMMAVQGFGKIGGQSVAVEKESDDPYLDFRGSMLQMILEKEIYSREDLRELLNCFLQLNSPYYHGMIVRAFTEIWNGVGASSSSSSSSGAGKSWAY